MENKITIIKLISGEVVMGRVKMADNNEIVITHPMQLLLDPTQGGVGMIPYDAIYTQVESEEHTFKQEHIMHHMPVHQSFEDAYIAQTTGISLPTIEV